MDKFRPRRARTLAFKGTNTGICQKLTQTNIFGLPGFGDESCRKNVFRMAVKDPGAPGIIKELHVKLQERDKNIENHNGEKCL